MATREISIDELADKMAADHTLRLIDVREPDEYESGHVAGAELIALGTVADNIVALRGDGPVYVICKSGGRSMRACEFLDEQGVDAVNIAGGTMAWVMGGRDVVMGDQPS